MWNSVSLLNAIAFWGLWIAAISGGIAAISALAGGLAATRASDITTSAANIEISKANARAEEAKADAAEANARAEEAKAGAERIRERLEKSQLMRQLTIPQAEAVTDAIRAMSPPDGEKVRLRFFAVEDAEAMAFAKQLQDAFSAAGVDVYPTDERGWPNRGSQAAPHPTGLALHCRSSDEPRLRPLVQAMSAVGLQPSIHIDESLKLAPGLLILRKPAA